MTKEEAIFKILSESALADHVENRIYPLVVPYGAEKYPYIVYSQQSRKAPGTKDGSERTLILAVSVVSKSYKEAHDIARLAQGVFYTDETTAIEDEIGLRDFIFESETEAYDLQTNSFLVKSEISYEYSA